MNRGLDKRELCPQFAIRNQLNVLICQYLAGRRQSQDAKFDFPRLAQSRLASLQVRVVISGMADELPSAFWNAAGDGIEQVFVECSRDDDAQGTVGGRESFAVYSLAKLAGEAAQDINLDVARPKTRSRQKLSGPQGQARPKRIAYRSNPARRCRAQQRTQNPGE